VDELVTHGEYQNASEVFRDSLRLLEQERRLQAAKLTAFRNSVKAGWDELDSGYYMDVDSIHIRDHIMGLRPAQATSG